MQVKMHFASACKHRLNSDRFASQSALCLYITHMSSSTDQLTLYSPLAVLSVFFASTKAWYLRQPSAWGNGLACHRSSTTKSTFPVPLPHCECKAHTFVFMNVHGRFKITERHRLQLSPLGAPLSESGTAIPSLSSIQECLHK